ncbi:MAG: antibiotic biosynthesis monooxygenase [Candidatus Acidiferrales bacterium]
MATIVVRFVVDLAINAEQFDKFESIAHAMIVGSQKEPGTLGYDWCLSADRKRCRLVETFADANAALVHMQGPVVQELVPKLLETASITRFEVYGDPGAKAAEMLAKAGAEIFKVWRGLSR